MYERHFCSEVARETYTARLALPSAMSRLVRILLNIEESRSLVAADVWRKVPMLFATFAVIVQVSALNTIDLLEERTNLVPMAAY